MSNQALLEIEDLAVHYEGRQQLFVRREPPLKAVRRVSLDIRPGEVFGLVGESGSGKSSLAKAIVGLAPITSGTIRFRGEEIRGVAGVQRRKLARDIQLVMQDPYASLNPRLTVSELIAEPWEIHKDILPRSQQPGEVARLMSQVGLDPSHADRYPHQLSGGQRQRVAIARALAVRPSLLVCDEPVSALDVSVQAQVLELLADLREEYNLTYIFVSHDLAVVSSFCTRVGVMYLGSIVEMGPTDRVTMSPGHPYTQALLASVPRLMPWEDEKQGMAVPPGEVPSPNWEPVGCPYTPRCKWAEDLCISHPPARIELGTTHWATCHFAAELRAKLGE